jgi:NAD(P)-dependent dehydrogenase (short-subunit alcohol dehydrogenase family)
MNRLKDKTVLVTGAGRGIGEAVARACAAEGALVFVTDIDPVNGAAVATSLGGSAAFLALDVREERDWQQAMDSVLAERGQLDVLVNNAGITGFEDGFAAHDPEHAELADWHEVHRTNLDGVFPGEPLNRSPRARRRLCG